MPDSGSARHRDIEFPPFGRQHLDNWLKHLAELAERARAGKLRTALIRALS